MTLGERIAVRRIALGYKQSKFAELVGVTPAAMNQFERSSRIPNAFTFHKIAEALDCTMDDLLGGESIPEETENERNET